MTKKTKADRIRAIASELMDSVEATESEEVRAIVVSMSALIDALAVMAEETDSPVLPVFDNFAEEADGRSG